MRLMTLALTMTASVLWLSPPAKSDDYEGNRSVKQLLRWCGADVSSNLAWQKFYCIGEIHGIVDMMTTTGRMADPAAQPSICPPQWASVGTDIDVFSRWASSHPEHSDMLDSVGIVLALKQAWPCQ